MKTLFLIFAFLGLAKPDTGFVNYWDILDELKVQMNYNYTTHTIDNYSVQTPESVKRLDNTTIYLEGYLYPNGNSYMLLKHPYRGGCDGIEGHYVLLNLSDIEYKKLEKHKPYLWAGTLELQPESKAPFMFKLQNPVLTSYKKLGIQPK